MDGHENDAEVPNQPNTTSDNTMPAASAEGGIFSSADTRVETENLTTIQPTSLDTAPDSVITPAIRTESTITEDLQLGGSASKKKWPIVLVGVVIAALLAVGGWILLSNQKNPETAYRKAKNAFLEYANFVLSGKMSEDELSTSCTIDRECYFSQAMRDESGARTFFEESAAPFEKFSQAVSSWLSITAASGEEPDPVAAQEMQDLVDLHEFLDVYQSHGALRKIDIVDYYFENGEADIRNYINNYYGTEYENNPYLIDLRESVSEMGEAVLENINIYAKYGCMSGLMNEACFATADVTDEERALVTKNNQIVANYGAEVGTYVNLPNDIIKDIIRINSLLESNEQGEQNE